MADKKSGQQQAVDNIIAQLEAGVVPWRKPWTSSFPTNLVSQKRYRGLNVFILAFAGYPSPYWMTFKQAQQLGGTVKRGEHGTHITKWGTYNRKSKSEDGEETSTRGGYWHTYTVFNLAQTEGIAEALGLVNTEPLENIPAAQAIWDNYKGRPVYKDSDHAWYRPSEDTIGMPPRERFSEQAEYYSTLFHEMGHSTGHVSRLNRDGITNTIVFGSEDYSAEELVAEFTSALLCGSCGIAPALVQNQAAYIKSWLTKLKLSANATTIPKAMSAAQKACDLILGEEKTNELQTEVSEMRASNGGN
jgi:antirestriction protein ArdC